MAVDTANKRYSMITLTSPTPFMLPVPDGTIGDADRLMFLHLYHGISISAQAAVTAGSVVLGTLYGTCMTNDPNLGGGH